MEPSNNSTRNKSQLSKMSSASSSANANEYDQYLKQYYIKKGELVNEFAFYIFLNIIISVPEPN